MTAYATRAQLEDRAHPDNVLEWADDDNDGSLSDDEAAVVDEMIEDASAMIDAAVGNRYAVPFPSTPQLIEKLCCDIAVYNLAARRGFSTRAGGPTNIYIDNYKTALETLLAINEGRQSIPGVGAQPAIQTTPEDPEPDFSVRRRARIGGDVLDEDLDGTLDGY
ncbi:MAG TPA: DUF1320 domain-containing protein [Phycisphaerae bacterium]|nr:DUF1320 domain-containing protein [Phycisphaerae bacterium]